MYTQRMWPNGTEVSRYTDKDMILSGFQIPAGIKTIVKEMFSVLVNMVLLFRTIPVWAIFVHLGTHIDLNPMVHFRTGEIFPDPDEFVPERWIRNAQDDIERSTDRGPFDMTAYKGKSACIKLFSFSTIDTL